MVAPPSGSRRRPVRWARLVAAGVLAGCSDAPAGPDDGPAPVIESAVPLPGTPNALSAMLSVRVRHADSVVVRVEPALDDSLTAAVAPANDTVTIPVLGLRPVQQYRLRPVAYGRGGVTVGEPVSVTTGALPLDLPHYTAGGTDAAPGYVVFAAGLYGVVIDNTGRVVWYHRFATGAGLSFMAQPNGRYVAKPPTPPPGDLEPWIEIDPLGRVTRTLGCARNYASRLHDLISLPDGSYWIMCDESRTMDLTTYGGAAEARVTGTVVQHVGADGALLFEWTPFDHFAITDVDAAERRGSTVNWTHGNSIDLDTDGNLLVSFRNLSEVTKIDTRTGAVIWRLGGRRNQLTFLETSAPAFAHQHGVRSMGAGTFVILDNIGNPSESRAERYVVNETARTARLAHSYGSIPGVMTQIGGSVQPLAGGRTLVSFGTEGRVEEYDAQGRLTWSIQGNAGYVFRAQRIRSLYAPGVGTAR